MTLVRPVLQRAVNIGRSEAVLLCRLQIVFVSGDQHDLFGFKIKEIRHEAINRRVGFVVAHVLCRQNAVPRQAFVFGHVGQQRDIAVGKRSNDVPAFQTR